MGQHKSFFFLFFFFSFFFSIPELVPLALREDVVSTGLWFVLLHLQKVFFALSSGKNNNETQSSHSGKIPKKQLRDYNKDKNVSKKKYAIFKISKFCYFYRDFPLSSNRALDFIWLPKFSSVPARLRRMLKDLLTYSSPN